MAFSVENIDPVVARLKEVDVPFTMSMSGRRAVFCRDPDGNGLEFMEQVSGLGGVEHLFVDVTFVYKEMQGGSFSGSSFVGGARLRNCKKGLEPW